MADFEHFSETAANICRQIERKLIALNIDWHDESALRTLAEEALAAGKADRFVGLEQEGSAEILARIELRGLVALMLRTMEEGAVDGQHIHGDESWKALARALWVAKEGRGNA